MQKQFRLTQNSSFNYIYRKGSCAPSRLMVIYRVPANNLKVGISVAKKVGNSVVRSKVKRRISESFRLLIPQIEPNNNFVIVAREGCAKADYIEISNDLAKILTKMNVLTRTK